MSEYQSLKEECLQANLELPKTGLVDLTVHCQGADRVAAEPEAVRELVDFAAYRINMSRILRSRFRPNPTAPR